MRVVDECPSCGRQEYTRLRKETFAHTQGPFTARDEQINAHLEACSLSRIVFTVLFCRHCGLAFRAPAFDDDELATVNSREFSDIQRCIHLKYSQSNDETALRHRIANGKQIFRYLAAQVERRRRLDIVVAGRRIVDIGGGDGSYLYPFLKVGMDCYCVDVHTERRFSERITYIESSLADCSPGVTFDCALVVHCLEHVPWPVRFLGRVREMMGHKGVVIIEVPLELPFIALRLAGSHPPHLTYFTKRSLYNALVLSELAPLGVTTCRNGFGVPVVRAIGQKEVRMRGPEGPLMKGSWVGDCVLNWTVASWGVKRGAYRVRRGWRAWRGECRGGRLWRARRGCRAG